MKRGRTADGGRPLPASRERNFQWMLAAGVVVLCAAIYGQTVGFGFVRLDDPAYVSENPHVLGGPTPANLGWALTSFHRSNWHPLTWISLQVDAALGGGRPGMFHATNLVLHAANACLLFFLLLSTTRRPWAGALAAALFAAHPLHVESVAWITERKDVLSTFFLFCALICYSAWARGGSRAAYGAAVAAAAAGLAAKPMLVTLPLLLLIWSWWPLDRWRTAGARRVLLETLPFWLLSLASAAVTWAAQSRGGAVGSFETFPVGARVANAVVAAVRYLAKTVWPAGLATPYPYDLASLTAARVAGAALVLAALSATAIRLRRSHPSVPAGFAWYMVTLLPVLGIVQVGTQSMADRYTYVPLVGIFAALAFALPQAPRVVTLRARAGAAAAACVVVALAIAAFLQTSLWRTSEALFTHAARVTAGNSVALNVLGLEALDAGRVGDAVTRFREALAATPRFAEAHNNLGTALLKMGDGARALGHFEQAVQLRPGDADARANLGILLDQQGRPAEAEPQFVEALRGDPANVQARTGYGLMLARAGRDGEALPHLEAAVAQAPRDVPAQVNLAAVLVRLGRPAEARAPLERALALEPRNARARFSLGVALALIGKRDEAEVQLEEAVRLDPGNDVVRDYLNDLRNR